VDIAREHYLKTYIAALATFAFALCASWEYSYTLEIEPVLLIGTVVLACFVLLGDVFAVRITDRTAVSACAIALIVAVAELGPTWAALGAIPSALYVGRGNLLRTLYELGHSITMVYLAGIAFSFVSMPLLLGSSVPSATIFYGTLVAGTTLLAASEVVNLVLFRVKYDQPFRETWQAITQPYLASSAVNVLTAGLGVLAWEAYGPLAAVVMITGSIGSQTLVYRSREQVKENHELRRRVGSLEEALANSNMAFGTMIIRDLGQRDG
jgi:hypothetical protein